jgi:hypothetical protein
MEHGSGHNMHGSNGQMSKGGQHEMMKNHMGQTGHDTKNHAGEAGHESHGGKTAQE